MNLVMDGQPSIGEQVAVFGQGVVGLLVTALLSEMPLASLVDYRPTRAAQTGVGGLGSDRKPHARRLGSHASASSESELQRCGPLL